MAYFNPDGEIKKEKISMLVKFRNEQDYIDFVKKTGITANSKTKEIEYSKLKLINDLFE